MRRSRPGLGRDTVHMPMSDEKLLCLGSCHNLAFCVVDEKLLWWGRCHSGGIQLVEARTNANIGW